MKVVLDTNVLVRGYPGALGPARRVLNHFLNSTTDHLIVSSYILNEVEEVLNLPRMAKRHGLTLAEISAFLGDLDSGSVRVVPAGVPSDLLEDPDDLPIMGTAISAEADVLCTRDLGFFKDEVLRYCSDRGIEVLTDLELIKRLK